MLGLDVSESRGIVRAADRGPDIAWFRDPAGNVLAVYEDDEPADDTPEG